MLDVECLVFVVLPKVCRLVVIIQVVVVFFAIAIEKTVAFTRLKVFHYWRSDEVPTVAIGGVGGDVFQDRGLYAFAAMDELGTIFEDKVACIHIAEHAADGVGSFR